ncbi:MAG: peroxiredoxin, partial [Pseudomonadota bacterium]
MAIAVGDRIPSVELNHMTADGMAKVDTKDIFDGKKVVMFAVPGAFTPTCSAKHVPGFLEKADELKAKGINEIVCVAVNDPFVMRVWGEHTNASGTITMLPDGNGEFTQAIGLTMDGSGAGLGQRSQRYVMVVDDGVVSHLAVEEPGQFDVSSASSV